MNQPKDYPSFDEGETNGDKATVFDKIKHYDPTLIESLRLARDVNSENKAAIMQDKVSQI